MSDIPTDETRELDAPPTAPVATSDETTYLRSQPSSFGPSQLALTFLAVSLATFLVGIALGVGTRQKADETVIASASIGSRGGTVRFQGGEVRFPRRAVERKIRVIIRRSVVSDRIRVEGSEQLVFQPGRLVAYRFEPSDVTFQRDVELTFRLPEGAENGTVFARRESTVVLLSGSVDVERGTATTKVRDFRFRSRS